MYGNVDDDDDEEEEEDDRMKIMRKLDIVKGDDVERKTTMMLKRKNDDHDDDDDDENDASVYGDDDDGDNGDADDDDDDDDDDVVVVLVMLMLMVTMMTMMMTIMRARMIMIGTEPKTTLCASLRNRNACEDFTTATLYRNLPEKCRCPNRAQNADAHFFRAYEIERMPKFHKTHVTCRFRDKKCRAQDRGYPLCASLRSRNARQDLTQTILCRNFHEKCRTSK